VSELFIRREPPPRAAVQRIIETLSPGAKLGRVSRLRGGLSNHMFSAQYHDAQGRPGRVVLRLTTDWQRSPAENARREFTTLQRLQQAGVPAPRPLLLDEGGEQLGRPGFVMSHEGKAAVNPARAGPWLRGLARAIAGVHAVTAEHADLSHLKTYSHEGLRRRLAQGLPEAIRDDPLGREIMQALLDGVERLDWGPPVLTHDDFWPGNVVWRNGRVSAIVDWTTAVLGDARGDVAQCRLDLSVTHGSALADRFTAEYEAATGRELKDVWFFDLRTGIFALSTFRTWIPGYVDSGLTYMTEELMEPRLRAFLRSAIERSKE
jgi:aminoglycoside phosphotransferase (APT) family kinase protein